MATFVNGKSVAVISESRGWIKVRFEDGTEKSVRAKQIEEREIQDDETMEDFGDLQYDEDEMRPRRFRVVRNQKRHVYFIHKHETNSNGAPAIDNGDDVAAKLRGMDLEDVYVEASNILGVPVDELHQKYEHLNNGMARMNLGNRIRKAYRDQAKQQ